MTDITNKIDVASAADVRKIYGSMSRVELRAEMDRLMEVAHTNNADYQRNGFGNKSTHKRALRNLDIAYAV